MPKNKLELKDFDGDELVASVLRNGDVSVSIVQYADPLDVDDEATVAVVQIPKEDMRILGQFLLDNC